MPILLKSTWETPGQRRKFGLPLLGFALGNEGIKMIQKAGNLATRETLELTQEKISQKSGYTPNKEDLENLFR